MKAACLVLAVFFAAACQTPPPPAPGPSGVGVDIFEDVPAPRTAQYVYRENESFSYRSRTFRCGRFQYNFGGSVADAAAFYRQTMTAPPYSWTLTDEDVFGDGSQTLFFSKNDDRCTVSIDRVGRPANVLLVVRVNYRR